MSTSPTLTLEQLKAWNTCREAVDVFRQRWPSGEAPLAEVVAALIADEQLDWWKWLLLRHNSLRVSWKNYDRIAQPALADLYHVGQIALDKYHRFEQAALRAAAQQFLSQQEAKL